MQQETRIQQRIPGLSIVGLGCSSFSNFFEDDDDDDDDRADDEDLLTVENITPTHPRVQEWIDTIQYAIRDAGITLLDTAPWYGHGTSEIVVGYALQRLTEKDDVPRETILVNTKIGRYEADPLHQFDFTAATTLHSIQRSLRRLGTNYIDVLQLHDPEFAPNLEMLLSETIPAMRQAQSKGWCLRLGMTGYPLEVQHQILCQSMEKFGTNIWDQALVYSHFNLHDTSLVDSKWFRQQSLSFADYCRDNCITLITAAPLSMGLLTQLGPPLWHPAGEELQVACRHAAQICASHLVDLAHLALLFALSEPCLPCTILGMKSVAQVRTVQDVAARVTQATDTTSQSTILDQILTQSEKAAYKLLRDREHGPFANVWKTGMYQWDGVQAANAFWKLLGVDQESWHAKGPITDNDGNFS